MENLKEPKEKKVMTAYESIFTEGIEKGMEKTMADVITNMLRQELDVLKISQYLGVDIDTVKSIQKKMVK